MYGNNINEHNKPQILERGFCYEFIKTNTKGLSITS